MLDLIDGADHFHFLGPDTGLILTVLLLGPVAFNLVLNIGRFRIFGRRAAEQGESMEPRERALGTGRPARPRVSILIPARNEEHNLPRLLDSVAGQSGVDFEVLVYDDGSEDATWDVIRSRADVTGVRGDGPPDGWYGKVHALHELSGRAKGDILLFLDADTELLDENALARLVRRYEAAGGGLITGITRLRGRGHLLVSVIGYAILGSIPWWAGRYLPSRLMAAVNGQCWMIDKSLYVEHSPHHAVRSEVLEDVMIGRYMYARGVRPRLVDAQRDVAVHMYDSFGDAWQGFRKNAYAMVGGTPTRALPLWAMFTVLYVVLPLLYGPALAATVALKLLSDRFLGVTPLVSIAAPVSFVLASLIILDSAVSTENGTVEWKGRRLVPRGAGAGN